MKVEAIAHKREKGAPVVEIQSAEVLCASGVAGDLAGKPGSRQVTLLSSEQWQDACDEVGQNIPWTIRRANILLSGVVFTAADVGKIVQIGEVQLEITKETVPCEVMDDHVLGLKDALGKKWNGGVCCRVVHDGHIALNDVACFV